MLGEFGFGFFPSLKETIASNNTDITKIYTERQRDRFLGKVMILFPEAILYIVLVSKETEAQNIIQHLCLCLTGLFTSKSSNLQQQICKTLFYMRCWIQSFETSNLFLAEYPFLSVVTFFLKIWSTFCVLNMFHQVLTCIIVYISSCQNGLKHSCSSTSFCFQGNVVEDSRAM